MITDGRHHHRFHAATQFTDYFSRCSNATESRLTARLGRGKDKEQNIMQVFHRSRSNGFERRDTQNDVVAHFVREQAQRLGRKGTVDADQNSRNDLRML